jgi:hypothetical protein
VSRQDKILLVMIGQSVVIFIGMLLVLPWHYSVPLIVGIIGGSYAIVSFADWWGPAGGRRTLRDFRLGIKRPVAGPPKGKSASDLGFEPGSSIR